VAEDLKNYDLGRTSLAVVNCPTSYAGQQIGELWVSYTIVLRNPKIGSGNAYNIRRDMFVAPPKQISASATGLAAVIADPSTLLAGARNSFNCTLTIPTTAVNTTTGAGTDLLTSESPTTNGSTYQQQFTLTIPDSYSGVLRIKLLGFTETTNNYGPWHVVSLAPATIARFKDMPQQTPASSAREWSHQLNTYYDFENAGSSYSCDCEMHLRVHTPFNGVPNVLQFALTSPAASPARSCSWTLEVTQINSFLSVQDNGKNDRIDFVQYFSGQAALYV
jgi:hypothetical protein